VNPVIRRLIRRMYADGRSSKAAAHRRECRQLEVRFGSFDEVTGPYAVGVGTFSLAFQDATASLELAQAARAHGKGRAAHRPSPSSA
jgi:hypothetical protein